MYVCVCMSVLSIVCSVCALAFFFNKKDHCGVYGVLWALCAFVGYACCAFVCCACCVFHVCLDVGCRVLGAFLCVVFLCMCV